MGRSHARHHRVIFTCCHLHGNTCKPIMCHFILNCKRPCNLNCSIALLMFCWVCADSRDCFPFVLFCNREAVGISKAQSTGMKTKEQKVTWKKTLHWSIKNYWPWIETFFKSYISAAKNQPWGVETAEWKIQSQAQFNLKISKRVFLKLLLHKSPGTVFWAVLTFHCLQEVFESH